MEIEIQIEHTRIPAFHSRIFGTFAMCIHIFYTGLCVLPEWYMYIFRLANTSRDHLFDRSARRCFGAYSIKMLVNIAHVLSYIPARHTHLHTPR